MFHALVRRSNFRAFNSRVFEIIFQDLPADEAGQLPAFSEVGPLHQRLRHSWTWRMPTAIWSKTWTKWKGKNNVKKVHELVCLDRNCSARDWDMKLFTSDDLC